MIEVHWGVLVAAWFGTLLWGFSMGINVGYNKCLSALKELRKDIQ